MSRIILLFLTAIFMSSCITPQGILEDMFAFKKNLELKERILYKNDLASGSCIYPSDNYGKILLIPIQGVISEEGYISDSSTSPAYIARVLEQAAKDSSIRAVVLYINSPGGTVTASDMIYRQIGKFAKATSLPIYAHISTLGASGAYYAAMSSQSINARPTARIGSIGVIVRSFSLQGLLEKYGVRYQPVASGANKDTGSIFKDMSKEEKDFLQAQLMGVYQDFLELILKSRSNQISSEKLKSLANGNVYDAKFAMQNGLIDSIDYFDDFILKISNEHRISELVLVSWLPDYMPATSVHELELSLPSMENFQLAILKKFSKNQMFYMWDKEF